MAGIGIRIRFIWVLYSYLAGVVASKAQWRFGIFTVGLQMAIKCNQKSKETSEVMRGGVQPLGGEWGAEWGAEWCGNWLWEMWSLTLFRAVVDVETR